MAKQQPSSKTHNIPQIEDPNVVGVISQPSGITRHWIELGDGIAFDGQAVHRISIRHLPARDYLYIKNLVNKGFALTMMFHLLTLELVFVEPATPEFLKEVVINAKV